MNVSLKKRMIRHVKSFAKLFCHNFTDRALPAFHCGYVGFIFTNNISKRFLSKFGVLTRYIQHTSDNLLRGHVWKSIFDSYIKRNKAIFLFGYNTHAFKCRCKHLYINIIRDIKSYTSHIYPPYMCLIGGTFTRTRICDCNNTVFFVNFPHQNPVIFNVGMINIVGKFSNKRVSLESFKEQRIMKTYVLFKFLILFVTCICKPHLKHLLFPLLKRLSKSDYLVNRKSI